MKKMAAVLAGALLLIQPTAAECLVTGEAYGVGAAAAIIMEAESGEVLFAQEIHRQLPMASTTKIMTAWLTLEQPDLWREFTVDDDAIRVEGSSMGLQAGDTVTLYALAAGMLLASGNDAAGAAAVGISGSVAAFAGEMNRRAAMLGMNNTHYVNACGLDAPGHVSSARDVAILSREMLTKHPDITEYTTIWTDSLRGGQTKLVNTNKLLRRYAGTNGLKTGTTSGAGVCITVSASRDGLDLIAVVLGAADSAQRFAAAKALLDYGFANFENGQIEKSENAPESLPAVSYTHLRAHET